MHISAHMLFIDGSSKAAHYMQNNLEQTGKPNVSIVSVVRSTRTHMLPAHFRIEKKYTWKSFALCARRLIWLAGGSRHGRRTS